MRAGSPPAPAAPARNRAVALAGSAWSSSLSATSAASISHSAFHGLRAERLARVLPERQCRGGIIDAVADEAADQPHHGERGSRVGGFTPARAASSGRPWRPWGRARLVEGADELEQSRGIERLADRTCRGSPGRLPGIGRHAVSSAKTRARWTGTRLTVARDSASPETFIVTV